MYNNNNFARAPGSDSPMRFNKRPRYGVNNMGGNNSPRFKHQNQSTYQFSPSRNNATDNYQPNQYEKKSSRNFYSSSPIRSNYNQSQSNKQSSPFSQKSSVQATVSPSSSTFPASMQNVNLPHSQPMRLPSQIASATSATQSSQQNQQQFTANILESNYYPFPYNFYPTTYSGDMTSAASASFGVADGMSPYMWQTITSTPPPKLPQQQPPLPLQQPPALPPLPSPEMPQLPPPPPIPVSLGLSDSMPADSESHDQRNNSNGQDSGAQTIVKIKAKRRAMSVRYKISKSWSEKDALLALKAEEANTRKLQKDFILVIRFPDPEISRDIVKSYSPDIESVHFQLNFAPRYCIIHLKPGTDVEKTIDHISKIQFGTGYLSVEIKQIPQRAHSTKLNEIDPLTLYVGNLPTTIACKTLKQHFPGAARIDIGFAQRMKYTRYAFIRYQNVQQAIEAYKRMLDAEIGGRTLTIRFRRLTAASDGNKDDETTNNEDLHEEFVSQATVASENNENVLLQTNDENVATVTTLEDKTNNDDDIGRNLKDLPNATEEDTIEKSKNNETNLAKENISTEDNLGETNISRHSPLGSTGTTQRECNKILSKIKPEPNVDPDDIVVRNSMTEAHFESPFNTVKQEEENVMLYTEFFERPTNQIESGEKSIRSDRNSLNSMTDETDTMSQLSSNSLGEFLQTCKGSQTDAANVEDSGPSAKRNKVEIKRECSDSNNIANRENSLPSSKFSADLRTVKKEAQEEAENFNTSAQTIKSNSSKPVSLLSRQMVSTTKSPKDSQSNKTTNDDIVPPSALFFTSEYHNKWRNSKKVCDNEGFYDEFYDTNISSQSSGANVKTEPSEISTAKSTNEVNKKVRKNKPFDRSSVVSPATTSVDDDDLVPEQNLLNSYRPLENIIKQESENDDLFSVPFSKSIEVNTTVAEDAIRDFPSQSSESENVQEISKTHAAESNDEDVVIISANIPPPSNEQKSENSVLTNLFFPRLTDLVSFNYKPIPTAEVSTLFYRDNLDKLYEQLDADSDSEL